MPLIHNQTTDTSLPRWITPPDRQWDNWGKNLAGLSDENPHFAVAVAAQARTLVPGTSANDTLYGTALDDLVFGLGGHDRIELKQGNDIGLGQAGNDYLYGQDGSDILIGGADIDLMSGGRGNDTMIGGTGGDTYRFGYDLDNFGTMDDPGHDLIVEKGEAGTWDSYDRIELFGYYGPFDGNSAEAYARLSFQRVGTDMVMISDGGEDSLTVKGQFKAGNTTIVEELHFNAAYWTPLEFKFLDGAKTDIDEDRSYNGSEAGEQNELLFGTDQADRIFGNSGTNFIWLGDGADTLVYKETDPSNAGGSGGGACNDIIEDFDPTEDVMDFSEIAGLTLNDLAVGNNPAWHASIYWDSGTVEVSNILIELRGVDVTDLTGDHFIFG